MTLCLRTLGRSLHVFQAWFILAELKFDHIGKFGDLVKNADSDSAVLDGAWDSAFLPSSRVVLMAHTPPRVART